MKTEDLTTAARVEVEHKLAESSSEDHPSDRTEKRQQCAARKFSPPYSGSEPLSSEQSVQYSSEASEPAERPTKPRGRSPLDSAAPRRPLDLQRLDAQESRAQSKSKSPLVADRQKPGLKLEKQQVFFNFVEAERKNFTCKISELEKENSQLADQNFRQEMRIKELELRLQETKSALVKAVKESHDNKSIIDNFVAQAACQLEEDRKIPIKDFSDLQELDDSLRALDHNLQDFASPEGRQQFDLPCRYNYETGSKDIRVREKPVCGKLSEVELSNLKTIRLQGKTRSLAGETVTKIKTVGRINFNLYTEDQTNLTCPTNNQVIPEEVETMKGKLRSHNKFIQSFSNDIDTVLNRHRVDSRNLSTAPCNSITSHDLPRLGSFVKTEAATATAPLSSRNFQSELKNYSQVYDCPKKSEVTFSKHAFTTTLRKAGTESMVQLLNEEATSKPMPKPSTAKDLLFGEVRATNPLAGILKFRRL